jgi:hypothetical protein
MFSIRRVFSDFGNKLAFGIKSVDFIICSKTKSNEAGSFLVNVADVENSVCPFLDVGVGFDL